MNSEYFPWLVLLRAPALGPAKVIEILQSGLSARQIINSSSSQLTAMGLSERSIDAIKQPPTAAIEHDLAWLKSANRYLLVYDNEQYPTLLRKIPDPPLVLFLAGNLEVINHPQIAIVGSRNPTAQGRENAAAFAHYLAQTGFAITSGLARGIDTAAHQGAIKADGFTVAVCGTGLDEVYPRQNMQLAGEIAKSGVLVSEFPTRTPAVSYNFPRRNRIISGLSVGTLVIEAAHRSGSLITARLASEQGREIFAVPGSIHNPMARGCHRLIRDGARLVESGSDIIDELGNLTRSALQKDPRPALQARPDLDADYDKILQNIGHEPSTVDQLCERTGLTADAVSSMLLILELNGYVKIADGGRYLSSDTKENP